MYGYDDYSPVATEADAHREWHINAGVKSGHYGGSCPWDACGHGYAEDYEAELAAREEAERVAAEAPALRPGEEAAPVVRYGGYGPEVEPYGAGDEPPF